MVWIRNRRIPDCDPLGFTHEDAEIAVEYLVVKERADGLLAVNDHCAGRLMRAVRVRGKHVPRDVRLVGCDNLDFGTLLNPPLTTIDLDLRAIARAMVDRTFSQISGSTSTPLSWVVTPELVVGESS